MWDLSIVVGFKPWFKIVGYSGVMTRFISFADQDIDVVKIIQFSESPWIAKAKLKRNILCMEMDGPASPIRAAPWLIG